MRPWRLVALLTLVTGPLTAQGKAPHPVPSVPRAQPAPKGTIAVGQTVRDSLTRRDPLPPPAPLPLPVAVLVSGGGTNLQALFDALRDARAARVTRVISSRPDAGALERARRAGALTTALADPASADEVLTALGDARLVVLA